MGGNDLDGRGARPKEASGDLGRRCSRLGAPAVGLGNGARVGSDSDEGMQI